MTCLLEIDRRVDIHDDQTRSIGSADHRDDVVVTGCEGRITAEQRAFRSAREGGGDRNRDVTRRDSRFGDTVVAAARRELERTGKSDALRSAWSRLAQTSTVGPPAIP
ncbi:MAG: hypothetical protein IPK52_22505 [Chloroflexi bacterium]|nr:hypothetical protein [Chloroflexota bacterium]